MFLQRTHLCLPNSVYYITARALKIKGRGKGFVGPFETLIVAQESLLLVSGDPRAGFLSLSEQTNLCRVL